MVVIKFLSPLVNPTKKTDIATARTDNNIISIGCRLSFHINLTNATGKREIAPTIKQFMKTLFILIYSQSHQDSLKIIKVDISIAEAKC